MAFGTDGTSIMISLVIALFFLGYLFNVVYPFLGMVLCMTEIEHYQSRIHIPFRSGGAYIT
jgi:hypothetical protein